MHILKHRDEIYKMSQRPEILFPLFSAITGLKSVGPKVAENLLKIDISRPKDLLFTLPSSIINREPKATIIGSVFPSVVTVEVLIGEHYPNMQKGKPYRISVTDSETNFQLVFFHAHASSLEKQLPRGERRIVSGKVEMFDLLINMIHPDFIVLPHLANEIPRIEPIYPLTSGISQKTIQKVIKSALERTPCLPEWIEKSVIEKYNWPTWDDAIRLAHAPHSQDDVLPITPARKRLAYDDFFAHQVSLSIARQGYRKEKGRSTKGKSALQELVLNALPFKLTQAQIKAISEITSDMAKPFRMNRLLQGDVGSGKTLVALMALICAVDSGGQSVLMAPTEILARQHLEVLQPLAEMAGVVLEILTGRDKGKDRIAKLAALKNGNIQILVGTHAVFQKDVEFKDLRLAIIDEQHRFGVQQRMDLGRKGEMVDVLIMTATPIPRSLTLAYYGDMDMSILDEKPANRKPIETVLIPSIRLNQIIKRLGVAIQEGKQAYWVCPLVEESDQIDWIAAAERHKVLQMALGAENVGLVHGQMSSADKDAAMANFISGETKILVATTVIEVGVNILNATIMVIEESERYGLAQLHQLRGRVGRGAQKSSCLLMYTPPLRGAAKKRLEFLRETEDGFRIADMDLKLRGSGDLLGVQQSGLPKFRIADAETQIDLLKMAHDDARMLLAEDPGLKKSRGRAVRILLSLMNYEKTSLEN